MYFADSAQQTIWRMTFNTKTGGLGDQEVFVSLKDTDCYPDGSAMDANGCLWNAQWGGSRVVQYAPDGSEKEIIGLPTAQPTVVPLLVRTCWSPQPVLDFKETLSQD